VSEHLLITPAELDAADASHDLPAFIRQAWPIVEPSTPYMHNWHIDLMCEYLDAVRLGEITRLIINVPPRYMKSNTVSVFWPCWEWTQHPELRYLFCSYAANLSTKHSLDRRRILESAWYQKLWPHVVITTDQNLKTEYENTARGVMFSTSVGGVVTGKGGNRIVIDDPLDPRRAYSDANRNSANTFFDMSLTTRLNDKRRDAIVLVMQRVHDEDLTGHILSRTEESWTVCKVPATEERDTVVTFPRSGREIMRKAGEPLWPEREGLAQLAQMKIDLASHGYAAQYQQDPAPPEGAMIKSEWWVEYRCAPTAFEEIMESWDMAFKDTRTSDFVVGQVWGRVGANIYLLDQVRGQWDIMRTIEHMIALSARWPEALLKLIEDKANGPAIIQLLNGRMPGIVAVTPTDSKMARCAAVAPAIEAGNVHIPDPRFIPDAEWVQDFLLEFSRFPLGVHDDQVDAATQALERLVASSTSSGISIGIIGGRIGHGVFAGSNLPRPQISSAYGGSNLPDPYGSPAGGSNLPGGARPGKHHNIW
jgi:predicted phage terminase large subunit-like protein